MSKSWRAFSSALDPTFSPAKNVRAAIHSLARQARLVAVSSVYCTDPLGCPEQSPYFNCVAEIETDAPPVQVKHTMLRSIEDELGRKRTQDKYAPRTIDLDLIVYGDLAMDDGDVRLPDPDVFERPFLVIPLAELAPELALAGHGQRVGDIADGMNRDGMRPLRDYSWLLNDEVSRRMG